MEPFSPDAEGSVLEKEKQEIKEPRKFKVILQNDDYTTFDFVVSVLVGIFQKSITEAVKITNDVHHKGSGICGIYGKEIAETKVDLVAKTAQEAGFPLRCTMEEV